MEAKELRLGNLVYDTEGKVNAITLDALKYLESYGGTPQCQVKPIPLTEEWLLRFGCSHPLKGCFYTVSKTPFIMYDSFKKIIRVERDWLPKKVEFVHQLQNIVDDLSDNKLELKD